MNNNCVKFIDIVDSTKMNGSFNSTALSKETSNSKSDTFNNIFKTAKDNKRAMTKYKNDSNKSCESNASSDTEHGKVEPNEQFTDLKESNYIDNCRKNLKKKSFSDDEGMIELSDELLNVLNELLDALIAWAETNSENFNNKSTNDNTEIDLVKHLSELVKSTNKSLNTIDKEQLKEIRKLSSELLVNSNSINNEELFESVGRLLNLTEGKNITKLGSELNKIDVSNLEPYNQVNAEAHNNTSLSQDKYLGEVATKVDNSDKASDKIGANIDSSTDKENFSHSDEFKLIYNSLNDKISNTYEDGKITDKFSKIDLNQYRTDSRDVGNLLKEVSQKTKFLLKENGSEVQIQLKPEILGKMSLKMSLEKGEMHAKAIVDNIQAKQLIDSNLIQLKETLRQQGIEVKTFEVYVGKDPNFSNRDRNYQGNKPKLRLKKASIDDYDDISEYYTNIFGSASSTIQVYASNFDIKA